MLSQYLHSCYNTNMYPNLFGIEGSSMAIMMGIGAIVAVLVTFFFLRKHGLDTRNKVIDYFIVVLATIFMGILFAMLFENVYEAIKHAINGEPQAWTWISPSPRPAPWRSHNT